MFVKISNLKMPIDAPLPEVLEAAEGLLHIQRSELRSMKLLRRSVDARHGSVQFVYTILAETTAEVLCDGKKLIPITPTKMEEPGCGKKALAHRPVIVGFGPCGMFCALWLARRGYRPLVLERGADVDARTAAVNAFWKTGTLNETTNVQFGEGGAGTFSDGKLTTRIGDASLEAILQEFVRHGAPEDILYNAMPHIGTDVLKSVVKNIREEILSLGGEIQCCFPAELQWCRSPFPWAFGRSICARTLTAPCMASLPGTHCLAPHPISFLTERETGAVTAFACAPAEVW